MDEIEHPEKMSRLGVENSSPIECKSGSDLLDLLPLDTLTELPETLIVQGDNSNCKRGRGRPKGSLNKKRVPKNRSISNVTPSLTVQGDTSNSKRGRGRPKGSLNKKVQKISEYGLRKNRNISYVTETASQDIQNSSTNDSTVTPNETPDKGMVPGTGNKTKPLNRLYLSKENEAFLKKVKPLKRRKKKAKRIPYQPLDVRDIPKQRFDEAMAILNEPKHPFWEVRNISCKKSVHRHWDEHIAVAASSDANLRFKFARQFLMRRDWINLSKVLSLSLRDMGDFHSYKALLNKYTSICLAHTDKQQFNKFVQFLLHTEDADKVLKKCTQISQNCTDEEDV